MDILRFSDTHCMIPPHALSILCQKTVPEIRQMHRAAQNGYSDDRCSINLPTDSEQLSAIKKIIGEQKKHNPSCIVVVGIGGSNLGTVAVQEAVLGKLYNQMHQKIKVLYADTVDGDFLDSIVNILIPLLKKGENVIINGVSKSGGTTETIANFEVLISVLKKYKKEHENYVVVTTDADSKYWKLAHQKKYRVLEIPKKVGGRYSVFSSVGLFPLGMLGIDIDALVAGAAAMRTRCMDKNLKKNPAVRSAAQLYYHGAHGRVINDLFLFSNALESVGKWYRQLMGESIGKEFDRAQKKVNCGITPTVSIGSTDLHSMAQLYLGGPFDKFTTFVSVSKTYADVALPRMPEYESLVESIQGKKIHEIMNAILQGVQAAFVKGGRPFNHIILPDKSSYFLGQLLQFKMMEMMYLGYLFGVNPFDQPNVEEYKIETKRLLTFS